MEWRKIKTRTECHRTNCFWQSMTKLDALKTNRFKGKLFNERERTFIVIGCLAAWHIHFFSLHVDQALSWTRSDYEYWILNTFNQCFNIPSLKYLWTFTNNSNYCNFSAFHNYYYGDHFEYLNLNEYSNKNENFHFGNIRIIIMKPWLLWPIMSIDTIKWHHGKYLIIILHITSDPFQ